MLSNDGELSRLCGFKSQLINFIPIQMVESWLRSICMMFLSFSSFIPLYLLTVSFLGDPFHFRQFDSSSRKRLGGTNINGCSGPLSSRGSLSSRCTVTNPGPSSSKWHKTTVNVIDYILYYYVVFLFWHVILSAMKKIYKKSKKSKKQKLADCCERALGINCVI